VPSRRGPLTFLAGLALALPLACGSPAATVAPLPGFAAKILMVRDYALRAILMRDRGIAAAFTGRTTYVVSARRGAAVPPMAGAVKPTASYASFAAFAADIAHRRLPAADHAVLYDPEKWAATPVSEQKHPLEYLAKFTTLAKRRGLLPILAPARDLALVPGGACHKRRGESLSQAYIRCGLAGASAGAAVLVVQSQVDQADVPLFHSFLSQAVRQARAGNRRIVVIAQLATAPLGRTASLAEMVSAILSVQGMVQGISLNVRMSDLPAAEDLLWVLRRS
jgi:hypothetical protein